SELGPAPLAERLDVLLALLPLFLRVRLRDALASRKSTLLSLTSFQDEFVRVRRRFVLLTRGRPNRFETVLNASKYFVSPEVPGVVDYAAKGDGILRVSLQ